MALDKLPNEVLGEIALALEDDRDMVSLMLSCRTLRAAVEHPRSFVWRTRYAERFDLPPGLDTPTIWKKYTIQQSLLSLHPGWKLFSIDPQALDAHLPAMLDLIRDCYAGAAPGAPSKNLRALRRFVDKAKSDCHELVFCRRRPYGTFCKMAVVQMALFHLFPLPRRVAYPDTSMAILWHLVCGRCFSHPSEFPLIEKDEQGRLATSTVFFIHYFFCMLWADSNATACKCFRALEDAQYPRAWKEPLGNELKPLGKYWRGTRISLPQSIVLDARRPRISARLARLTEALMPEYSTGPFKDRHHFMSLDFEPSHQPNWDSNADFEFFTESRPSVRQANTIRKLNGQPKCKPTPAKKNPRQRGQPKWGPQRGQDYLPFVGEDSEKGDLVAGNMHCLPPAAGLPGFRRITFLQYARPHWVPAFQWPPFFNAQGKVNSAFAAQRGAPFPHGAAAVHLPPPDLGAVDLQRAEATLFDGVALPGGRAIVGRWYRCYQDRAGFLEEADRRPGDRDDWFESMICGPFIYWCIDP